MVSVLGSRPSSLGLNTGWGHCVVFLSKTLHSQSTTLPSTLPVFRTEKSPGHDGKFLSELLVFTLIFPDFGGNI